MGMQGSTTVSFGSGALDATATVTGMTGLGSGNLVEAWPLLVGGDDSPWVEQIKCYAGNIVPDTGSGGSFTIYVKPAQGNAIGTYSIGWVWN